MCNWCGGYVDDLVAEEGWEEGVFYHPDCWKKVTMKGETNNDK